MTFDVMAQNVSGHHGEFFVDIFFGGGKLGKFQRKFMANLCGVSVLNLCHHLELRHMIVLDCFKWVV